MTPAPLISIFKKRSKGSSAKHGRPKVRPETGDGQVARVARWLETLKASRCLCLLDGRGMARRRLNFSIQPLNSSWHDSGMATKTKSKKNPAALALGWLGGLKGGPARTARAFQLML